MTQPFSPTNAAKPEKCIVTHLVETTNTIWSKAATKHLLPQRKQTSAPPLQTDRLIQSLLNESQKESACQELSLEKAQSKCLQEKHTTATHKADPGSSLTQQLSRCYSSEDGRLANLDFLRNRRPQTGKAPRASLLHETKFNDGTCPMSTSRSCPLRESMPETFITTPSWTDLRRLQLKKEAVP